MQISILRNLFTFICLFSTTLYLYQVQDFNSSFRSSWKQVSSSFQSKWLINPPRKFINNNITNSSNKPNEKILDNDSPNLMWYKGRFDRSRKYRIYEWVWTSKKWDKLMHTFNVCLATQGSLEKVFWLLESVKKWNGPISVAIYLINLKEFSILTKFIKFARNCSPEFADYVSIHLAFPANIINQSKKNVKSEVEKLSFSCGQIKAYFDYLIRINTENKPERRMKSVYPQNHMRNIARKTCTTHWVSSLDIDIIPAEDSAMKLQTFYKSPEAKKCKKCCWVIPTFELSLNASFPYTKLELITYAEQNLTRQFHVKYHDTGHRSTNYFRWMNTNLKEESVRISHDVNASTVYYYEPFYIAPDSVPEYDERFVGYGYTRNSQIDESMVLGWKFSVLTPIFAIHWGMKDHPAWVDEIQDEIKGINKNEIPRDQQDASNFFRYLEMMKELELKQGRNQSFPGYNLRLQDKQSSLAQLVTNLRNFRLNSTITTKKPMKFDI